MAGDLPKVFGTFTGELERLRDWFLEQGVHWWPWKPPVVYWLYVYDGAGAAGL